MHLNCGAGEDSWKPLGQQQDQPVNHKSTLITHWKYWCWSWSSHLMLRADSLEKSLGKIKSRRRRGRQRMDEMAGQHHWRNEHELGQSLGDGEGQGGLACCSPWGRKERPSHVPLGGWTTTTRTKWSYRYYAYGGKSMFKWIQIRSENKLSLFLFQREFRHCLWNKGTNSQLFVFILLGLYPDPTNYLWFRQLTIVYWF